MYKVVSESDMVLYLVSDAAQVETHQKLFENFIDSVPTSSPASGPTTTSTLPC